MTRDLSNHFKKSYCSWHGNAFSHAVLFSIIEALHVNIVLLLGGKTAGRKYFLRKAGKPLTTRVKFELPRRTTRGREKR